MTAAAGARIRLVAVTDGEASHPGLDQTAADELAECRAAETVTALAELGAPVEIVRLRMPDTGVARREAELRDQLTELVAGFGVCLAPWDGDLHADHEAAGRAAAGACAAAGVDLLSYPIWTWHWAHPRDSRVPWDRAVRVPLSAEARRRKQVAIDCFASQLRPPGHAAAGGAAAGGGRALHPRPGSADQLSGETLDRGHFDGLYDAVGRPVRLHLPLVRDRVSTRSALAMLPWPRYRRAFEPGCSIGVLTALLAPRCEALLALRRRGGRGRGGPGPDGAVPAGHRRAAAGARRLAEDDGAGADPFDLIVLSELLYYLSDEDLARTVGPGRGRAGARGARCWPCTGGGRCRSIRRPATGPTRPWPAGPS